MIPARPMNRVWKNMIRVRWAVRAIASGLKPRAAPADAAHIVEGQGSHAHAIVFEVKFQRMLAGGESIRVLPSERA